MGELKINDNMSKADILLLLKGNLRRSRVEDIRVFTVGEWKDRRANILNELAGVFSLPVIVRSSSLKEDRESGSLAGCFHSELGVVPGEKGQLSAAIEKVIASYSAKGEAHPNDQVIVQTQTSSIASSGVVFTRTLGANAPYYVINYDDTSGKTDTVTGGVSSSMICVYRGIDPARTGRWRGLLEAVMEIEGLFPGGPLDIEFAVKTDGEVVIFQARRLSANALAGIPDDMKVKGLIGSMQEKFARLSRPVPHLGGKRTIFGDMPDWNPAEMIGSRPNTLDYSLYSFLITDSVWHEARSTLGYRDVFPGELMISLGKRPYIDTRVSFNSLIPFNVPDALCAKLVDYYLDKLEKYPERQDKVEFEIVWSCFNFSLERELGELKGAGFSCGEIETLRRSLFDLTNRILAGSGDLFRRDSDLVAYLTARKKNILSGRDEKDDSPWTLFNIAYNLLQNCRKFGILPFARLARLAFIGKSLLISLRDEKVISGESYHNFLNSVQTVASGLGEDLVKLRAGKISREEFLDSYGHLRPGTYDITALRYADMDPGFFERDVPERPKEPVNSCPPVTDAEMKAIDAVMGKTGLYGSAATLLKFIATAIEYRELAKLEFTRTLSGAIEFIAMAGAKLGFSREDLSQVDLGTLMKFRNPEYSDIEYSKNSIRQSMERHKKEKKWSDLLVLPPVIMKKEDMEYIGFYKARPNFITGKTVHGPVLPYEKEKFLKMDDLGGHIIFLENADPGYDWIFARNPLGIVTKYGGVASHMAIRCAEFGIPAAIGCGPTIYDSLVKADFVVIDGSKQTLEYCKA